MVFNSVFKFEFCLVYSLSEALNEVWKFSISLLVKWEKQYVSQGILGNIKCEDLCMFPLIVSNLGVGMIW